MKINSGSVKPESTIKTSAAAFLYWKAAVLVFELPKAVFYFHFCSDWERLKTTFEISNMLFLLLYPLQENKHIKKGMVDILHEGKLVSKTLLISDKKHQY